MKGFLKALENVGKQIWAVVSDYEGDLDVWKLAGLSAFVFSAFLAVDTMNMIHAGKDVSTVGIAAGLVTGFITVGTFLMGQSHAVDKAQISTSVQVTTNGGQ
jgi:hypothetical protein